MAFWSAPKNTEARRNFKFLVDVNDIPVWIVKKVNLPTIEVGQAEHKFLNHTFYFPGSVKFNEVSFTIVDSIDKYTSTNLIKRFVKSGYNTPDTETAASEALLTKEASVAALGSMQIRHLGSDEAGQDKPVTYRLMNPWIKKIEFPQGLDYTNDELSETTITVQYDFFHFLGGQSGDNAVAGFGGS